MHHLKINNKAVKLEVYSRHKQTGHGNLFYVIANMQKNRHPYISDLRNTDTLGSTLQETKFLPRSHLYVLYLGPEAVTGSSFCKL